MTLNPGSRLGPYDILTPLGAGGFGEVYKAKDARLDRTVAIKMLPSADPELKARFEREAKAIAALTHPHICTVYDVGHQDGTDYLVMEFLEGTTLAARIAQGPIRIDEALTIAMQIAGALQAAHRAGIVHRDLKPANVMLTRSGAKLLDFGLAKLRQPSGAVSGFSVAATATKPLETAAGTILGTLSYMSPEQLESHDVDARTDIFSCGVVLYECIAGRRPFDGLSPTSVIASILKEEPHPLESLQPLTTPALSRVVRTCLEKDPEKRWQSAAELSHALTWISSDTAAKMPTGQSARPWQVVAALSALLAAASVGRILWPATPQPASQVEMAPPGNVSLGESLAVSPDGRKLVISSSGTLWLRSLEALEWRRLAGTEGAVSPFWSPDSRFVAFGVGNELRKIDAAGGPPETICTVGGRVDGSGSWNRAGVIVFGSWGGGSGGPLWRVPETGGPATAVTQIDPSRGELFHTWPSFLPDGSHFVYFRSGPPEVEGIYAGSLDVPPGQQSRERIVASSQPAAYAADYLFFPRAGALIAQRFDTGRLQLRDAAIPIAEAIGSTWYGTGVFGISSGGSLAYRAGAGSPTVQIRWADRQGKTLSVVGQPGHDSSIVLSPDAKRAVVKDSPYDVPGDLWILDLASGQRTRLTFRKDAYTPGVWSPDGARIAYAAGSFGDTIYERSSSGVGGERELLKEAGLRHFPTSWSRDGRFLLYHTQNTPKTGYDLWALGLTDTRTPARLLGESFNEWAGVFSPDSRWIAYASLETGTAEVFVRPFRTAAENGQPTLGESKWQISRGGGNWPIWHNASEIVFHTVPSGSSVFAVPVKTSDAAFESGTPQRLFMNSGIGFVSLVDSTADGQRFLVPASEVERDPRPLISVVLNWPTLLSR